ncbi:lipopolysaccharide heptosyltransferase family protein [Roseomonas nepalensis]|uniref:Lipopolysaccharide heptosyltransferase family protein n=1 Tax=Muricoccus nepalensis TaxID=1854500 RepID=A0A502G240_9PROT|nr:glycosyltransferase family 9 protein [Roseomonas nepalensis]TPG55651.1 lipopolysaccharide heptosyltransferase family protein [Roseomonas nepalensis]
MSARVLVIKLGALGDVVQAFGPFAAIRAHHPGAEVTLLTTPPFAELARRSPWFDRVWDFGRPRGADWSGRLSLLRALAGGRFERVYDLQTSPRSSRYRLLVGRRAEWSGVARGASHPHDNPGRNAMHTVDRQREQLRLAGITDFPPPDLSWLEADLAGFGLPPRFALLIPGASPSRPGKRWPGFPALAAALARAGLPAVVAGGAGEAPLAAAIRAAAPDALDLTGRTGLFQLAALARRATVVVGNDTGPTHLAGATGRPTLALFGSESDPARCAPRGTAVSVLRREPIAALPPEEVAEAALRLGGLPA